MATLFDEPFDFIYIYTYIYLKLGEQCLYKLSVNLRKWESVNLSTRQWYILHYRKRRLKAGFKSFKNHAHVQLSGRVREGGLYFTGHRKQGKLQFNLHRSFSRNFTRPDTVNWLLTRKNTNLSTLFHGNKFIWFHPISETLYFSFLSLINSLFCKLFWSITHLRSIRYVFDEEKRKKTFLVCQSIAICSSRRRNSSSSSSSARLFALWRVKSCSSDHAILIRVEEYTTLMVIPGTHHVMVLRNGV